MTDLQVRTAFHRDVLKKAHACEDTFVVDELGLKNGQVRADIAVLNGKLIGYEIKTDSDTLARLPHQITAYNEVFQRVYIVTGKKHLDGVCASIPEWWGIYLIQERSAGSYSFKCHRKAKANKSQDSFGLSQLLWKDEVVQILTDNLEYTVRKRTTKEDLYGLLSSECSTRTLSKLVLKYLKSRSSWRTNQLLLE